MPEERRRGGRAERLPGLSGALRPTRARSRLAMPPTRRHDLAGDDVALSASSSTAGRRSAPEPPPRQAVVDAREDVEQVFRARASPELEARGASRWARESEQCSARSPRAPRTRARTRPSSRARKPRWKISPAAFRAPTRSTCPISRDADRPPFRSDASPIPVVDDHRLTVVEPERLANSSRRRDERPLGPVGAARLKAEAARSGR
jgi:hypothetical protein